MSEITAKREHPEKEKFFLPEKEKALSGAGKG